MDTDVLFEDPCTAEETLRILKDKNIPLKIRRFISYRRVPEMDGSLKYTMLSPFVLRGPEEDKYRRMIESERPDSIMVRNMEELGFLLSIGYKGTIIADAHLYSFNSESRETLRTLGVSEDTVPYELNIHEIRERGCEGSVLVIYGRTPLMISVQCVKKTESGKCMKTSGGFLTSLKDRKNTVFPVRAECDHCYNIIYNSVPLCLFKDLHDIESLGLDAVRIDITTESPEEASDIIYSFCYGNPGKAVKEYTRGHFRKGVD